LAYPNPIQPNLPIHLRTPMLRNYWCYCRSLSECNAEAETT